MPTLHYKFPLIISLFLLLFSSCSDEEPVAPDTTVHYAISLSQSWTDGLTRTRAMETRAVARPDAPTALAITEYPQTVFVAATNNQEAAQNKDFTLTRDPDSEDDTTSPEQYYQYHTATYDEGIDPITMSEANDYTFVAKTQLPLPDPAGSTAPWQSNDIPIFGHTDYLKAEGEGYVTLSGNHILFKLQHQTAFIRFVLGVSPDYLNLRDVKLKKITITYNDTPQPPADSEATAPEATPNPDKKMEKDYTATPLSLDATGQIVLDFHLNPALYDNTKLKSTQLKVTALYDVYDKSGLCIHQNRTASNNLDLTRFFKDTSGNTVLPTAGRYYDILVTLDPDFIYVLSDNDNGSDLVFK